MVIMMDNSLRAIGILFHILLMVILCGSIIGRIHDESGYFTALIFVIALLMWTIYKLYDFYDVLNKVVKKHG